MKPTRLFNGETYYIEYIGKSKQSAADTAKKLRNRGKKARVVGLKRRWKGRGWTQWSTWGTR